MVQPAVLRLARAVLVHALHNADAEADASRCVDRVVHLLELAVHVARSIEDAAANAADSAFAASAASASDPAAAATLWTELCWTPAAAAAAAERHGGGVCGEAPEADGEEGTSVLTALHALAHGQRTEAAGGAAAGGAASGAVGGKPLKLCLLSTSIARWVLREAAHRSPECAAALRPLGGAAGAAANGSPSADAGSSREQRRKQVSTADALAIGH